MKRTNVNKKFTKLGAGATAVVIIAGSITPVAFANAEDVKAFKVYAPNNDGVGIESNNDMERRKALEEKYQITLTDAMVWEDKKGKVSHTTEEGEDVFYTSHDEMKAQGFYVVNANRQELIQYGIKTGDWQPYRSFEAEKTPAYFEIVDNKYEYSKVYFGQMIRVLLSNHHYNIGKLSSEDERAIAKAEYDRELNEYLVKFRNAPGEVPYVVGLNNTTQIALNNNVPEPADGFFDSKYNHPSVLSEGKFKEDVIKEVEEKEQLFISSTLMRNDKIDGVAEKRMGTVGLSEVLELDLVVEDDEKNVISMAKEFITISYEDELKDSVTEDVFKREGLTNVEGEVIEEETPIQNEVKPPTDEELAELKGLKSNDDTERRKALEEEFGVELTEDMVWEDKKGKVAGIDEAGNETYYTSHDEMKKLGFYAVNANRQELIQYAIKTGDWYPYRALEAKTSPAYFELIDGKYEYNKVYYGSFIENAVMSYRFDMMQNKTDEEKEHLTKEHQRFLKEYIAKFNEAPGIVPYVIGLNNTSEEAKENGVEEPFDGYFDSKWNYPTVKSEGKFNPEYVENKEDENASDITTEIEEVE